MTHLLHQVENDIRGELADIVPAPPADAPTAAAPPVPGATPIDYDMLAAAIVRAQARAAGTPLPADGTPAAPPPAPEGAVVAPADTPSVTSPEVPAAGSVFAGVTPPA